MKMSGRWAFRGSRKRAVLGAVAAAALVATGISANSVAHAESNRRICEYSFMAMPKNFPNPLMHVSLGMNYKRHGACPAMDASRLAAAVSKTYKSNFVDVEQVLPNPAEKWDCESWGSRHQTYLDPWLGSDPCTHMDADVIYAFFWQDPTTPNPPRPDHEVVGHYHNYEL
jgi:hypothetical protein